MDNQRDCVDIDECTTVKPEFMHTCDLDSQAICVNDGEGGASHPIVSPAGIMGCGAAEASGLGFVYFQPSCVVSNIVDFGLFLAINFHLTPSPPVASFHCICAEGYELDPSVPANTTCKDINECDVWGGGSVNPVSVRLYNQKYDNNGCRSDWHGLCLFCCY